MRFDRLSVQIRLDGCRHSPGNADHQGMTEFDRLHDMDVTSLDARIAERLECVGKDCVVQRFTLWYTGRSPVHVARLLIAAA